MIDGKLIFVIEHCKDCHTHKMSTRHDPKVYENYAEDGKFKIYLSIFICFVYISEESYQKMFAINKS